MARPKTRRDVIFQKSPDIPGLVVTDMSLFTPPSGIDRLLPVDRLANEFAYEVENLYADDGLLRQRDAFTRLDTTNVASDVVNIFSFVLSSGISFLVRFRTTTVQYWNGTNWITPSGAPTLTGTIADKFSVTAWNNQLVFSNGVDGIYQWNLETHTVTTLTTTYAAKQLTTFIGRVIGSDILDKSVPINIPHAIRWSAKNNSADWTGLGSGYEDFLSTPGGYVDRQMGVFPVNDSLALAFRENSTWLLGETGNLEAPIRISRKFASLGTRAPRSLVAVPGAVIGVFNDDVHIVSESTIVPIGRKIWPILQESLGQPSDIIGAYNHKRRAYLLMLPNGLLLWFSLRDKAWTKLTVPYATRDMIFTSFPFSGLTIGTSPGTFGAASGTIGSEVSSEGGDSIQLLVPWDTGNYHVVRETPGATADEVPEAVQLAYTRLFSGFIHLDNQLEESYVIEIQIKYESELPVAAEIVYSHDKWATQSTYSSPVTFEATDFPKIVRVTKQLTGNSLSVGIQALNALGSNLKIISVVPRVVKGHYDHP